MTDQNKKIKKYTINDNILRYLYENDKRWTSCMDLANILGYKDGGEFKRYITTTIFKVTNGINIRNQSFVDDENLIILLNKNCRKDNTDIKNKILTIYELGNIKVIQHCKEIDSSRAFKDDLNISEFIHQYRVGNYRLDYYSELLNIVIECDENDHNKYDASKEKIRHDYVNLTLGNPKWVRYNPDSFDPRDISIIIRKESIERLKNVKGIKIINDKIEIMNIQEELVTFNTEIMDPEVKAIDAAIVPLEQNIFEDIGTDFDSLFKNVRIFGTVEVPLFVADDVKKLLGLKDMKFSRREIFKEGVHRVVIRVDMPGKHSQNMVAFTEDGLYLALMRSTSELAKHFQMFVSVVLKRLRLKGSVSLQDAVKDYNNEKNRREMIENQLDETHQKLVDTTKDRDRWFNRNSENEVGRVKAEDRLEHNDSIDAIKADDRRKRFERRYMKPITFYIVAPPEHLKDNCDYDYESLCPWETVLQDTVFIWTLYNKKDKIIPIKKLYVHKGITVEMIMETIKKNDYFEPITKLSGEAYTNYFEDTLENLEEMINDLNIKNEEDYERLHPLGYGDD